MIMQQTRGFKQVDYLADKLEFESDEWRVLMWLSRIENKQRVTKELPRGQFYMSQRDVADKLKISQAKVNKILKMLREEGVITPLKLSKSRHQPSIYKMECISEINQKIDQNSESVNESVNESVQVLEINACTLYDESVNESVNKSLLKEILKNNKNNKNITSED